jgi:hypothetical protein
MLTVEPYRFFPVHRHGEQDGGVEEPVCSRRFVRAFEKLTDTGLKSRYLGLFARRMGAPGVVE